MSLNEFFFDNRVLLKSQVFVSADFQDGAFIGEFEEFFWAEWNELTVWGIILGHFVVSDDLMFLDFADEFGIFCFFEGHVKDSSGLDFFALDGNFLGEKVPGELILGFGRGYFLALKSTWLTAERLWPGRAGFIAVSNEFKRMLNSLVIFDNRFTSEFWVLGAGQI